MIFEIAQQFPHCIFYIVGGLGIDKPTPVNIKLVDKIPNQELRQFISNKQFYMQLSMSEGFPNALSEAMLCECVPIVSNVGGMPDIVSDCGYILKHKNINELYELVNSALNNFELGKLAKKARQRVVENYTFESRKEQLLLAISKLI